MTSLPGVTLYSPNSPYWTIVDMRRNPDIKKITDWYQNYAIDLLGKIPDQLMDPEIEDWDTAPDWGMRILIQGIRSRTVWMIDIPENPYLHINRLFPQFNRLRSIKQYGTGMQYVGGSGDVISLQDHDRANHSYQVALSAERMGRALGLSNREIHILIYGGLLHDVATPGLGDITKLFFGIKSEETIFEPYIRASADYINSTGRIPGIDVNQIESYLRDAHDMSLEDIHRTIVGKGSIGEVLDIADRFTYTLEDTRMYFGHVYRDMIIRASRTPEIQAEMDQEALVNQTSGIAYWDPYGAHSEYNTLAESILRSDPHLSDIFEEIAWIDERPVFTNPDRAIRILRLRAVMHHLVYFNPYNWALEHYIGLILKYLVDQGDLSMNTLLYEEWGEIDIDRLATARWIYPPTFITGKDINPFTIELFNTKELANTRMNDLQSHERGAFIRKIPSFKSGLHYLAQGPDGQVTQLKNLYPEIENELAELSNKTAQYALYVLRDDIPNFYQNCPQFLAFLKREWSIKEIIL